MDGEQRNAAAARGMWAVSFAMMHVGIAVVSLSSAQSALAALEYWPGSHIVQVGDDRHFLVMLTDPAPNPPNADWGALPNGRMVQIHQHFSVSGMYTTESSEPLWTIDEIADADYVHVHDERYIVIFKPSCVWLDGLDFASTDCIKFYDHGNLIRSYDLSEVVDYISLVPQSEYGNGWDPWVTEYEVAGDRLTVRTATRETVIFDIVTGEMLTRSHFWKLLVRTVQTVTSLAVFVSLALLVWNKRRQMRRPVETQTLPVVDSAPRRRGLARLQYSTRGLLIVTAIVAVVCGLHRWLGRYAISVELAAGALSIGPAFAVAQAYSWKKSHKKAPFSAWRHFLYLSVAMITSFGMFWLSLAIVCVIARFCGWPGDVQSAFLLVSSRPIVWWYWLTR